MGFSGNDAKEVEKLADLETFGPQAFVGDDEVPQEVCDLVLALALAYNDLRDPTRAQLFINSVIPSTAGQLTKESGDHCGMITLWRRVSAGQLFELLVLIEKHRTAIEDPVFARLRKQLSPEARDAWDSLVAVAINRSAVGTHGKVLLMIRHKVGFHYDSGEIARGYMRRIIEGAQDPFISRGGSMESSRFYFTDAAAEEPVMDYAGSDDPFGVASGNNELTDVVNLALYQLVTRYFPLRNVRWREPRLD